MPQSDDRVVLGALKQSPPCRYWTPIDIMWHLHMTGHRGGITGVDACGRILARLTASGHAQKIARGKYVITDAGRAVLAGDGGKEP